LLPGYPEINLRTGRLAYDLNGIYDKMHAAMTINRVDREPDMAREANEWRIEERVRYAAQMKGRESLELSILKS
jgi:hypothetical protein